MNNRRRLKGRAAHKMSLGRQDLLAGIEGMGVVGIVKNVEKKILPEYYKAVRRREKTFELRKDEDDIQPGDILTLLEWDGENYTGHKITRVVTYVLRDCPQYGLEEGYCIIGSMPVGWDKPECWASVVLD